MRTAIGPAVGAVFLGLAVAACAESTKTCGSGESVRVGGSAYCVYEQAIVIVGGFDCPASMRFRRDFESATVCSDHGFDGVNVPEDVCARVFVPCTDDVTSDAGTPPATCGRLGCQAPNAVSACMAGVCTIQTCNAGFADCDANAANGCEVSLNDNNNCGQCGNACSTPWCLNGECQNWPPIQDAGALDGGSSCRNPRPETCDRQDNDCDGIFDEDCARVCPAGFADCNANEADGCETSLDDDNNCGACGSLCSLPNASARCTQRTCLFAGCDEGFGNCDGDPANGCETALNTADNCGSCGTGCALCSPTDTGLLCVGGD